MILLLLVIAAIASFAPPPLRGIIIILVAGLGIWYSTTAYTPFTKVPKPPENKPKNKNI